eukprot:4926-Amphidinium_carterae.1
MRYIAAAARRVMQRTGKVLSLRVIAVEPRVHMWPALNKDWSEPCAKQCARIEIGGHSPNTSA